MTKAIAYIEVDLTFCALRYGETTGAGTCPAVLGVDSDIKCHNTLKTCAVRESFLDAPVTLRFAEDNGLHEEAGIDCIASIKGISFTPSTVSLGKDLGTRASLSVTFKDHLWPDTGPGGDPYLADRPYDPVKLGSFWGKFRSRQPFLRGRAMRLIRGYVGQAIGDMETRHYVIDSFGHNTADGSFQIVAKDALKLADNDRAQAPRLSNGFLNSAIDADDIVATLQPSGIGDIDYPASGYVAIGGKEICGFSRDVTAGNDADTKLLLHMDGADAATTFTDSATSPKTVTANGNAQLDTAQKPFGLSSGLFDGTGDYLSLVDSADWLFAGNFTIDFWARHNALASTQFYFTHFTDANNRYFLSVSSAGALTFSVIAASVTTVTMSSAAGAIDDDGDFHHIAVVRNGNAWAIYVDGVSVATTTDADAIPNFTNQFRIGVDHAAGNGFNGWLKEFRVSHVARWTAAFTPPPGSYQSSADIINLERGQHGTEAIEHEGQDRVQLVLVYEAVSPADIIRDLLVNYAGVPDGYIPLGIWQTEIDSFLDRVLTAIIADPTGVQKLVSEVIEDAALSLWWDDVTPQLRLRVLRAISTDAELFDASNYMEGSFSSREQPNIRLSQIWRYFGKRNPLEGQEDPDNYRSVAATVDLQAETDYGSSLIHKIFSRWISFGGRSVAVKANQLYLSRFRDPPRRFNFSTFRDGKTAEPVLGQGYRISGMGIQDETGAPTTAPIQITRLNPGDASFEVEAEEMLAAAIEGEDLTDRVIIIDVNSLNLNLKTIHDTLYPEATDQDVLDGVNLTCIIETGVIVGSATTALRAFDVDDWPVGFPITLIVNGRIQGAGGRGGDGSVAGASYAQDGFPGGVALYTRHPINLEIIGEIFGGAAGGGGFNNTTSGGAPVDGWAGGGGSGSVPGAAGVSAADTSPFLAEPGTTEAGGEGARLSAPFDAFTGGDGGDPGQNGDNGTSNGFVGGTTGGAAGAAIDGDSFVTVTVGPGSVLGPTIN